MASAATSTQMVLKTTRHGLLASLREDADWDELVAEVGELRARGLQTLDDTAITFDLGWREISGPQFEQLIQALKAQGLECLGILSTSHQTRTVAEERGYRAIIGRLGLAKHQGRRLRKAALTAAEPPAPPEATPETESKAALEAPIQPSDAASPDDVTSSAACGPEAKAGSSPESESRGSGGAQGATESPTSTEPQSALAPGPLRGEETAKKTSPGADPETSAETVPETSVGAASAGHLTHQEAGGGGETEDPDHDSGIQSAPAFGDEEPTLYLRRTLRSGQRVVFGGNVVLLGDLNPGAQIEADGDVIVLGQLRGSVHAGCEGDRNATVVTASLQASQLRIADSFFQRSSERTFFKRTSVTSAVRARLEGDQIVLEPLPAKQ